MKYILLFFVGILTLNVAANPFYYYKNQKVILEENTSAIFVLTQNPDQGDLRKLFNQDVVFNKFMKDNGTSTLQKINTSNTITYWAEVKFSNPQTSEDITKIIGELSSNVDVILVSPYFKNQVAAKIGLSQYLNVKLKNTNDYSLLTQLADQYKLTIEGQNKYMPLWYTLSCSKVSGINALQAANTLFETGFFEAAEPDLMTDDGPKCVNDASFNNQWGHLNTGQGPGTAGIDINACEAWSITKGVSSIIISVLDEGIEMNHPDLQANIFGTGFDTESGTSPSQVLGSHGTACGGIVAAIDDNSIGVSGVAPNCRLMSVSNSLLGNTNSRVKRADGINWSYLNGAAVISNSWVSATQHQVIDDAIADALTLGRGGLGTCVVFATGNDNLSTVGYPANAMTGILAIGAMSPCGERKNPASCDGESWWGSNYGTEIDVVAPGVLIPTTDRQGANGYNTAAGTAGNYTQTFNGTSSATPHVAALCGLILSANPCLTRIQVNNIIERTAQKVGGYSYVTTAGRSNGTWNSQMGYGLIDAEAAVKMAGTTYLQNLTQSTTDTHKGLYIKAGFNVNPFITSGNYTTNPTANINIQAQYEIDFQPGCDLRGTVDAIITAPGACSTW
jgi:subtilisin family serine protease